jgi:hypothetical protein
MVVTHSGRATIDIAEIERCAIADIYRMRE